MSQFTLRDRFEKALKGEAVDIIPVCSVTQTGTVELMETTGAYWPQANFNADKMLHLHLPGMRLQDLRMYAVLSTLPYLQRPLAAQ